MQRDVGDVRAQLSQSARAAAEDYQSVFVSGEQITRAVGSIADVRAMTGNCDTILSDAMIGVSYFTNLSRATADGTIVCSALPLAKGINISAQPQFQGARKSDTLIVGTLLTSRATGLKVIGSQVSLHKPDGSFDGTLAIADDGVGFRMDEKGKSVGSRLIRTFGAQLGGVASVTSKEGQGTVVSLVFPDPAHKDEAPARKPEAAPA